MQFNIEIKAVIESDKLFPGVTSPCNLLKEWSDLQDLLALLKEGIDKENTQGSLVSNSIQITHSSKVFITNWNPEVEVSKGLICSL